MKRILILLLITFLLFSCNNIKKENEQLNWWKFVEIKVVSEIDDIACNNKDFSNEILTIKNKGELFKLECFYKYKNWDLQCKKYSKGSNKSDMEKKLDWLLSEDKFLVRDNKIIARWYNVNSFENLDYMYQSWNTFDEALLNPEVLMRKWKVLTQGRKVKSFLNWYYKYSTKKWNEILIKDGKKIDLWLNLYNIEVFDDETIIFEQPAFLTKQKKTKYNIVFKDWKKIVSYSEISYENGSYSYTDLNKIAHLIINWEEKISFDLNKWEYKNIDEGWILKWIKETWKRILSWGANSLLTLTHSRDDWDYWFIDPEWKLNLIIWGKLKIIKSGLVFAGKSWTFENWDYSYHDYSTKLNYLIRKWKIIAVWNYVASCKNWDFYYIDENKKYHLMGNKK